MTRTLVIGLDACDPVIAGQLMAAGRMPVLAQLAATGGSAPLVLPDGLFVGVVWPVLTRGVDPASTGRHSWIDVDPVTYELTPSGTRHLRGLPVWDALDATDRHSLLVDVPHVTAQPRRHVTQLVEWGCHDHHVGLESWPPELSNEVTQRFGGHPLLGTWPSNGGTYLAPDDYLLRSGPRRTPNEAVALSQLVAPGVELKTDVSAWLLERRDWDLAIVAFGESHAVGHQLWHLHDPAHPHHHPSFADLPSPIETTYQALDVAVGRLIEVAGTDVNVVVVLTHGMGPHYDAVHLLEAVLGRLDTWLDRSVLGPATSRLGGLGRQAATRVPRAAYGPAAAITANHLRRRGLRPGESTTEPEITAAQRAQRRFFRSWNNDVVGGVRLNLVGRESAGRVHPSDADAVLGWLERQLRALVDVDTGRPLVARTYRCAEHFPAAQDTTLPDLFVEWHRTSPIERVWSPTVGVVHHEQTLWRTGDHLQRGRVLARGPGIVPGFHDPLPLGSVAAGLTHLFGVELPGAPSSPPSWWRHQAGADWESSTSRVVAPSAT